MGVGMRSEGVPLGREADRQAREDSKDLVSYLVGRFVVVFALVMVLESVAVWVVSVALPPVLRVVLGDIGELAAQQTTSVTSLLGRLVMLAGALLRGNYLQAAGLLRGFIAVLLVLVSFLLLLMPPFLGALGFARTVERRVRQLREQREREIEMIEQQRSQFLTDVAHDLRTPLMAISGMAHAINDGVVRDEAMRDQYLCSIGDKADKMGELVASVFDYAKTGSGAFLLERTEIDLPQLLLREAAVAYTDIEKAGMRLSVDVSEERCVVDADATQLARVVANLLTNAVRHNAEGTEIALLLVRQAGVAHVVVADTGGSIEQAAEELFRPFSRGDASRSKPGDTGLGLSICKRIAELHGYGLQLVQPYGRFSKAFVLTCVVVG